MIEQIERTSAKKATAVFQRRSAFSQKSITILSAFLFPPKQISPKCEIYNPKTCIETNHEDYEITHFLKCKTNNSPCKGHQN